MAFSTSGSIDHVDFHFDPMCPFAYQTAIWIREVRRQTGLQIDWKFFSLEEINLEEGKKHPWERDWSYGWSLMRIAARLRRDDPARVDDWYARIGRELHENAGAPHDPATARRLLTEIGVEETVFDDALADESTHDEIRADHDRVVAAGGYGVPTLFFPDGSAYFGPVLIEPPTGDDAVALWELVVSMTRFPHVYEIQRLKAPADQKLIRDVLDPYLRGRAWKSINRGEVIEFDTEETTDAQS